MTLTAREILIFSPIDYNVKPDETIAGIKYALKIHA